MDIVRELRDDCPAGSEVGFLWAVVDQSKYGNLRVYVDPDFSSAASSSECQSGSFGGGVLGFEYPVIKTGARRFSIGTPRIEVFGIDESTIETFTAVSLDIEESGPGPVPARTAGAGIPSGIDVAFYNAGASQVEARALEPNVPALGSNLGLSLGTEFGTVEASVPGAVWSLVNSRLSGSLLYVVLVNTTIPSNHALESGTGGGASYIGELAPPGTTFTGQATRFVLEGTCGSLGYSLCPSASSKVVRIFSLQNEDPASPSGDPTGLEYLTFEDSTGRVVAAPREDSDFQLWIVQEL